MRLKDGKKLRKLMMGFYSYTDLEVEVEIRRKKGDI